MNANKHITLILTLFMTMCASAQIAMDSWRTHTSYTNVNQITQSKEKVYGVSSGSLFSVYKDQILLETYSKIEGLSDNNIAVIKYSKYDDVLFIAYNNSNIDLLYEDGNIDNITDLYQKSMSGSKKINNVYFTPQTAYLACDFGIVALNIKKKEFTETYILETEGNSPEILNVIVANDTIYALTKKNLFSANIKSNLINYQNWTKLNIPDYNDNNVKIEFIDNELYLLKNNQNLYKYHNNNWKLYKSLIKNISYNDGYTFIVDNNNKLSTIKDNKTEFLSENAVDGLFDKEQNKLWYIANTIIYSKELKTNGLNMFVPNGPRSNTSWCLKYSDGRIFSVPGGRWDDNYHTNGTLSIFEDGIWDGFPSPYFEEQTTTTSTCYDLVDIAINPNDKTNFWVASYGLGLYEFRNDKLYKFHHCDNSGLLSFYQDKPANTRYNYTRTDGMTYDNEGNLWILNNGGSLIKYIDKNGVYHSMPYDVSASTPEDIVISNTNANQKFVLITRYKGSNSTLLFSFDDNGTLDQTFDDKTVSLTTIFDQDNKEINFSTHLLRSIAQDNNGSLWVGTTEGLFLINDTEKMFERDLRAYRIKIPRNDGTGLADYLLGTEEIKAIAVDGANRKWIGTQSSGLYLVSEDGLETIHHFTAENSPLLSNTIQSIAINHKTGEVFIGTSNGLVSYQSDAIESSQKFDNVHAYPNPVHPDFVGSVAITGLMDGTSVRITDINGNLLYETISNGGAATWNICRPNGEKVATGVYFAHCISADRKHKHIAKILIIK